jgi:hypothetical protein
MPPYRFAGSARQLDPGAGRGNSTRNGIWTLTRRADSRVGAFVVVARPFHKFRGKVQYDLEQVAAWCAQCRSSATEQGARQRLIPIDLASGDRPGFDGIYASN